MNKKTTAFASAAAVAGLLLSASAVATPVDYNGAKFDVLVTGSSGTSYNFRYTADFTSAAWLAYRAGANTLYIDAVGFGISGYNVFGSVSLTGWNAAGAWTPGTGTINSSGCVFAADGQGPCANVSPVNSAATLGTYYWDFTASFYKTGTCDDNPNTPKPACTAQSVPDADFLQTTNQIRADFYTNGVMSLAGPFTNSSSSSGGNKVPESSSTLVLLGLGMLGLGFMRRRQQSA
jgi:hypothetical protein